MSFFLRRQIIFLLIQKSDVMQKSATFLEVEFPKLRRSAKICNVPVGEIPKHCDVLQNLQCSVILCINLFCRVSQSVDQKGFYHMFRKAFISTWTISYFRATRLRQMRKIFGTTLTKQYSRSKPRNPFRQEFTSDDESKHRRIDPAIGPFQLSKLRIRNEM